MSRLLNKGEQEVKSCLETLIKFLGAEAAKVEFVENDFKRMTFEVSSDIPEDRGKIIGKNGQNMNAMRTIVYAYAKQWGVTFANIHLND